jgi:uncharacterized membrane protein
MELSNIVNTGEIHNSTNRIQNNQDTLDNSDNQYFGRPLCTELCGLFGSVLIMWIIGFICVSAMIIGISHQIYKNTHNMKTGCPLSDSDCNPINKILCYYQTPYGFTGCFILAIPLGLVFVIFFMIFVLIIMWIIQCIEKRKCVSFDHVDELDKTTQSDTKIEL